MTTDIAKSWTRLTTLGFACALALGCEPQDADPGPSAAAPRSETPPRSQDPVGRAGESDVAPAGQPPGAAGPRTAIAEPPAGQAMARAAVEPVSGHSARGTVEFIPTDDGTLRIVADLEGLEPGPHGVHVHEIGDCSAPDTSAGDHFAPDGDPHGAPTDLPDAHHAGDLGNLTADEAGVAELELADAELELTGRYGVVDRAVIVHATGDDLMTQPSGASGDAIACGVIEYATGAPEDEDEASSERAQAADRPRG